MRDFVDEPENERISSRSISAELLLDERDEVGMNRSDLLQFWWTDQTIEEASFFVLVCA